MPKKITKEDIDEKAIIESFLQEEPPDHISLIAQSESEAAHKLPNTTGRLMDESRRKGGRAVDYEKLFVKDSPVTARVGKLVNIRPEFHDNIQSVCHVTGNRLSISAYIDNVLAHHFDTYGKDVERFYNENHRGIKINK